MMCPPKYNRGVEPLSHENDAIKNLQQLSDEIDSFSKFTDRLLYVIIAVGAVAGIYFQYFYQK